MTRAVRGSVTTHENGTFGRRTARTSAGSSASYTWNALGQLAAIGSADATLTFAYGASGMRERMSVETSSGTAVTEQVWTGGRLQAERDSDGTRYRYLYGPDGLPLSLLVTRAGASAAYTYHCDRAGSVMAITSATGEVVATYDYDPYGALIATGGSDPALASRNPLRYRGYCYDTATALYYLPARYYEPATARFLSVDPAPPEAGDPLSLNAYAYCVGDPVNASDPSGRRHVADGGLSKVSHVAQVLAKDGRLEGAKAVQATYRGTSLEDHLSMTKAIQAVSVDRWDVSDPTEVHARALGSQITVGVVSTAGAGLLVETGGIGSVAALWIGETTNTAIAWDIAAYDVRMATRGRVSTAGAVNSTVVALACTVALVATPPSGGWEQVGMRALNNTVAGTYGAFWLAAP